jgi:hypothetical protein
MHVHAFACMNAYIHTDYTFMHLYACMYAYIHTDINTSMHVHACIHAYMHTCIHAYIHTHTQTHTHTILWHTYRHTYLHYTLTYIQAYILTLYSDIHTGIHTYIIQAYMHTSDYAWFLNWREMSRLITLRRTAAILFRLVSIGTLALETPTACFQPDHGLRPRKIWPEIRP